MRVPEEPAPICECGKCGKIVLANKQTGKWNRYRLGHAMTGRLGYLKGKHLSEETKQKISQSRLGKPTWNKGRTGIYSEETKKRMSLAKKGYVPWMTGKHHTDESKQRISKAKKGKPSSFKGKHHSEEAKRKIAEAKKGKGVSEDTKKKISASNIGKHSSPKSEETKRRMSLAKKGNYIPWIKGRCHTEESKQKMSNAMKGKPAWNKGKRSPGSGIPMSAEMKKILSLANTGLIRPEEERRRIAKKISVISKLRWQNPEYKEKSIKAILKGLIVRPTSLEKQMIEIIQRNNLPYKYTGDGSFLVGYKNPDFVNVNGEKVCIEVGNVYHHQNNYEEKRIAHFKGYGWECIVFIGDKLDEEKVLTRLKQVGSA